jgi:glutamate-1-semialdehyde 2,1-aminomutase
MIFNFGFSDADFDLFCQKFVAAGHAMQAAGWWWTNPLQNHRAIRRQVLKEIVARKWSQLSAAWR